MSVTLVIALFSLVGVVYTATVQLLTARAARLAAARKDDDERELANHRAEATAALEREKLLQGERQEMIAGYRIDIAALRSEMSRYDTRIVRLEDTVDRQRETIRAGADELSEAKRVIREHESTIAALRARITELEAHNDGSC